MMFARSYLIEESVTFHMKMSLARGAVVGFLGHRVCEIKLVRFIGS